MPKEGAKVDTDGMWIPKGLPENELHWAKEYVNFAMSQEGAAGLDRRRSACPACARASTPPADLVGDPAYPTTREDFAKLLSVPTPVLVEHEADWFAEVQRDHAGLSDRRLHACRATPCGLRCLDLVEAGARRPVARALWRR